MAKKLGQEPPSYKVVHAVIGVLEPALVTLAHEGSKAFSESFDLVHRREADAPNAIWQGDHTELDILVKDTDGTARRPWLTIIIDDYSRAVAAYLLSFSSVPSAIQTALAEFERELIVERTKAGMAAARARGRNCGRPYTMTAAKLRLAKASMASRDTKVSVLCSVLGITRQTLYRHVDPKGNLRPDGQKLLCGQKQAASETG